MKSYLLRSVLLAMLMPATASAVPIAVKSETIDRFAFGSSQTVFGRLEFLGGLVMTSTDVNFGAWSSIRFRSDQKNFVGVLDTGGWITGQIERDASGRLSGLSNVDITQMLSRTGRPDNRKQMMDAEGLAFRPGQILVSFERKHRVDVYPDPGFKVQAPLRSLPKLIPEDKLVDNKSLETVVVAPKDGPLAGAAVVVAEESLNAAGDNYAAVLDGPRKGVFFVRRHDTFDISDGTFLPNGDLVLLERGFSLTKGIRMRLRLIRADDIKPNATVDGEELMVADSSNRIDNMEGVDAFRAADGTTHLILISDDNLSFLQKDVMLEFRLKE